MIHGVQGYRKHCRCDVCRHANWMKQKEWRDAVKDGPVPATAHGTINGYKIYGCRCELCAAEHREVSRRRRADKRILVALAAKKGVRL